VRHRALGNTGLKVTAVSFGCMITSDGSVIERAADVGINYFDTARGYQDGNNERMVGAALRSKRKSLLLSSKTHSDTKDAALADLDTSLKTLGTDYLDIWYLHARSRADQVNDEFLEAQRIAKKASKFALRRREHARRTGGGDFGGDQGRARCGAGGLQLHHGLLA
jgi:aryl-alcohol dehydrogenase-like predicted oxidoreductase